MRLEPGVEIEVIWKDVYMLELRIAACNGCYSGTTEVYMTGESLVDFANSLTGFPRTREQVLSLEAGEQSSYGYFSMRLHRIDAIGHTAAQIKLERESSALRPEAKDKLELEMLFEPASLDTFREQLLEVGHSEAGKAVLVGYAASEQELIK